MWNNTAGGEGCQEGWPRLQLRGRIRLQSSAAAGAIAATSARSPGLMDFGSNLRTLAAILVSASAIDIGGAASFLRDGGTKRTGLMRATITARRYGLFIPMACRSEGVV